MASLWRRAMVYLGLADDDEYDEYDESGLHPAATPMPSAAHPQPPVQPVVHEDSPLPPPQRPSVVRTITSTTARVHIVEPDSFNDAQDVGDRLKADQPVILNLQGIERDLQRRFIDFSSGLAYALGGHMARVADEVFLLTPANVEVSVEEKERLQARGLYNA